MSHNDNGLGSFDVNKAIAAIAYLVEKTGESMYPVMKMMYVADKLHLERHGRFIAGDDYVAMAKGPVPSYTYEMIKHLRGERSDHTEFDAAGDYLKYSADHMIEIVREPDYEDLSRSDIAALDAVIDICITTSRWAIRDLSHDSAWEQAWNNRTFNMAKMPAESIAAQFEDADALIEHLRDRHPGEAIRKSAAH